MLKTLYELILASFILHNLQRLGSDATKIPVLGDRECTFTNKIVAVQRGWPYLLDCDHHLDHIDYLQQQHRCLILSRLNYTVLYNESIDDNYEFPDKLYVDVQEDRKGFLVAAINGEDCTGTNLTLNHTEIPSQTCNEDSSKLPTINQPVGAGDPVTLPCQDASALPLDLTDQHVFNVTWYYKCSSLPSNALVTSESQVLDQLRIFPASSETPGIYTCAVTYNGMTRLVVQYHVCITLKSQARAPPAVTCNSEENVRLGENQNVTLKCIGNFGQGVFDDTDLLFIAGTWSKDGSTSSSCTSSNSENSTANPAQNSCLQKVDNPYNKTCLKDPALAQQQNNSAATITFFLFLRNVDRTDLGLYTMTIISLRGNTTASVLLSEEIPRPPIELIIGLCVGIPVAVVLIAFILYFNRFYLALYKKRWFDNYTSDDRQYHIFLSYHFSQDDDGHSREQTRQIIKRICSELNSIGYRFYDDHQDAAGLRAENAIDIIKESHRLLIVLTDKYISDDWAVFQLQQGFMEMIESKHNIIFVLVPGMTEYLKQHTRSDDTLRMIKKAIKMNYKISWPLKSMQRFRLEMEYAMPKLKLDPPPVVYENRMASSVENGGRGQVIDNGWNASVEERDSDYHVYGRV